MTTSGERPEVPQDGTERETLTAMLDFLRATVVYKVAGLSDEQAFSRPVPASELTPAGVVKHLTGVERFWFSIDFADTGVPWPWTSDNRHGNFPIAPDDTLAGILAGYQEECARSRKIVAAAELADTARSEGYDFSLRFALTHMIHETGRHAGHLDLLRETLDGSRGV